MAAQERKNERANEQVRDKGVQGRKIEEGCYDAWLYSILLLFLPYSVLLLLYLYGRKTVRRRYVSTSFYSSIHLADEHIRLRRIHKPSKWINLLHFSLLDFMHAMHIIHSLVPLEYKSMIICLYFAIHNFSVHIGP